jgi:hypothetical protein
MDLQAIAAMAVNGSTKGMQNKILSSPVQQKVKSTVNSFSSTVKASFTCAAWSGHVVTM